MPQYDKPNIYQTIADTGIYNTPTLAEQKMALLSQKSLDKKAKVNPDLLPETDEERYQRIYGEGQAGSSGIIDAAQADLTGMVGRLYDTGHNLYARAAEQFDLPAIEKTSPEVDRWSDTEYVNKLRGYNPTQYNQEMEQISQKVANKDFGSALWQSAMNMPETLARSASAPVEFVAGSTIGALFGGPVGAVAANAGKLGKIGNAITNGIKLFRNGSIYGADMANKYATEYEEATGQQKPAAEVASDFAIATVLGVAEFNIFKGIAKEATVGTFTKTAKDLLDSANVTQGVLTNLTKTVLRNGTPILEAMGKEGLQEYFETWHGIIAASDKKAGEQFANAANQHEALTGAVIGAGTGGSAAAAPKVVSTAATTALNVGTRTAGYAVEKGVNYGKKKATEAAYNVMPQEARDKIKAKYVEDSRVYEETKAANEKAVSSIGEAKTVEDLQNLQDPQVSQAIETILDKDNVIKESKAKINEATTEKELADIDVWTRGKITQIKKDNPTKTDYTFEEIQDKVIESIDERYTPQDLTKNIEKIKNEAIAQYNLGTDKLLADKEAVRAKDFVYQASKGLYDETKKAIDKVLPEEVRAEIVKQAKLGVDLAKTGIDLAAKEVKDLNKSAVRAVIDDIAKGKLNKAVYAFSEEQLQDLKKGFKDNAKATSILNKAIEIQKKSAEEFEILKKDKKGFLAKVVDGAGKLLKSDTATKLQGLAELTADKLTDSDNLYKAKQLVKALEDEKAADPKAFPKEGHARLRKYRKLVNNATKNGERGLVNEAIFQIGKAYRQHKVTDKTKGAAKATSTRAQALYKLYLPKIKKMAEDVGNSDFVKNFNKYVDELDTKLEEAGAAKSGIKKAEVSETQQKAEKVVTKEEVAQGAEVNVPDMATISGDDYDTLTESVGGIETLAATLSETDLNALATNTELSTEAQFLRGLKGDAELSVQDKAVSTSPDKAIDGTMSEEFEAAINNAAKIKCKGK